MNLTEFKRSINRGMGSVILELMKNQGSNEKYREAVLYACLNNTCYDAQSENERTNYLFEAMKLVGDLTYFEDKIVERLNKTNDFFLSNQLRELVFVFWKNGSSSAADVLQNRFDVLIRKLAYSGNVRVGNPFRENVENSAILLMEVYGIQSFFESAKKFGSILMRCKRENVIHFDWFLLEAERKFGKKRIRKWLEKESLKSKEVRRFLDEIDADINMRKEYWKNYKEETFSAQNLIWAAENIQTISFYGYSWNASKKLSKEELIVIADRIDVTTDENLKKLLFSVFRTVDYPYSVEKLLEEYNKGSEELKDMLLIVLARFKDKRINELAVHNLENGIHLVGSLDLMEKNFIDEYELIRKVQRAHRDKEGYDYHWIAGSIRKIFETRRNPKAKEILLFDYYRNRCSYCRSKVVDIMCKSKCIPDYLLDECLHDCCGETRRIVEKYRF